MPGLPDPRVDKSMKDRLEVGVTEGAGTWRGCDRKRLHNAKTREGFPGASTFSEVVRQDEVHLFKAGGGEEWSKSSCECPTQDRVRELGA